MEKVSVITASYNAGKYIAETIKSVQVQTYQNWELLITDDASTDNTCNIIEEFTQIDDRIQLFRLNENSGPAKARNHSIKRAKGRFIAFLDADDVWLPEKLEAQVKTLLDNESYVCFSSYLIIDESGKPLKKIVQALPNLSFDKLLKNNYIGNLTGIYDAQSLGKIYMPNLKKRQDWCLWLEALRLSEKPAIGIQKILAKYRVTPNSLSRNKFQLLGYNFMVYHRFLKFSRLKSLRYLILFLFEYFFVRPNYITKTYNNKS